MSQLVCQLCSPRPSNKEKCMTHFIFLQVSLALCNVNSVRTCPGWTEAAPSRGVSSSLPLDASANAVCGGVDWRLPCYRVSVWLYPAAEMNNMMSVQPSVSDKQCARQFIVRGSEIFFFPGGSGGGRFTVFAGKLFYCSSTQKEKHSVVPEHIFNVAWSSLLEI